MSAGLAFTSLLLGLRHGIDWDHIAAIADLTSTAESRRRGFILSLFYSLGHAVVVCALGIVAIAFSLAIPEGLDAWMGRVVGATLVALGAWVLVDLARNGRNFRLRSRWMLVLGGAFAGLRRVRGMGRRLISVEHDHEHPHEHALAAEPDVEVAHDQPAAHDHSHAAASDEATIELVEPAAVGPQSSRRRGHSHSLRGHSHSLRGHSHSHRHDLVLPETATAGYGGGAATGIGMLHGVGIESPTQIAVFVASTSVAGFGFGLGLLLLWCAGLVISNAAIAALAGAGVLQAERNFVVYASIAVIVSVLSIGLGLLYLFA